MTKNQIYVCDATIDSLNLYLVDEGAVSEADMDTEWDGERSVLVAATSEQAALAVAAAYDRGEVIAGNLHLGGEPIAAVYMRDPDTGLYA